MSAVLRTKIGKRKTKSYAHIQIYFVLKYQCMLDNNMSIPAYCAASIYNWVYINDQIILFWFLQTKRAP